MDSAKQGIMERGAQHGTEGQTLAKDVAHLVDQGKVFVKEKNPNQELQKLQHAGKRLAKNAPNAGGTGAQQYFEQMQERYDDLAELASRIVYSNGTRRVMRRVQSILLEALSSTAGRAEEKFESGARQSHPDHSEGSGQSDLTGQWQSQYSGQDQHQTGQHTGQSTFGQSEHTGQGSGTTGQAFSGYSGQGGFSGLAQTGQEHQSSGQSDFTQGTFGQSSYTGQEQDQPSGQSDFTSSTFGQSEHTGQGEYKDRPIDEPSALSGPDSFGYGIHEPHHEGENRGSGMGQGSGSKFGSGDIVQQDTKHTRKNYKVIIRGQEYDFLKDELSQDQRDWVAEEAQNICIDIASDDNLKDAASAFVRVIKSASQVNIEQPDLNQEAKNALEDSKKNLKALLDHMAEGYDFNRIENAWDRFNEKTKRNDELERDWKDFFGFIKESFLSKRLAMSHDWTHNFTSKLDCLRDHLMSIKPEFFHLLQEFDCFMEALKDDKFISETSKSVEKLSKDLFLDKNGNFEFKPEALKQIRDIIVPEFIEQFKYIAIPPFKDEDDTQCSEISNAVFKSEGLSPDDVLIQNTTDIRLTRKDDNVLKTSIHVLIKGMKFDIQDMHIKYQRKVFPQLKDEGTFNVRSTGAKGVKLELWLSASPDNAEIFKVDGVDCTISGLRIYDSHVKEYTFLFTIFKPLLQTMMRKEVEKAIESKIKQTAFNVKGLKAL